MGAPRVSSHCEIEHIAIIFISQSEIRYYR